MASVACTLPPVSRHSSSNRRCRTQFAALGARARAGDVIENPRDFGAGKIGIDDQTGFGRDRRLVAFALQSGADIGGAAVLPDDGAVNGCAGGAVPHHGGLALVGDADRGDVPGGDAGLLQRLAAGGDGRGPDVLRLVLDPAGRRKMLREFLLARMPRWRCRCETRWRARTWCPDRWPAQRTWRCFPGVLCVAARQADWRWLVNMMTRCSLAHPPPRSGGEGSAGRGSRSARRGRAILLRRPRTRRGSELRTPRRSATRDLPRQREGEKNYTDAVVTPPSTTMVWPVMKLDASEPR